MPMKSKPQPKAPSVRQRCIAASVMGVLVLIAVVMGLLQGRFNAGDWREQPATATPAMTDGASDPTDGPAGLTALSPLERYTAATLSDKINGKAELYLDAGFQKLESHRFALESDRERWMERYVYTMDGHANAYSVFSRQRRQEIVPLEIADDAYIASNGLFFVHGPYYVEIISGENTTAMQTAMKALAAAFIEGANAQNRPLEALDLVPQEHRVPHTAELVAKSAFGLEGLDWVYTVAYEADAQQAVAFIVPCDSPGRAAELAALFSDYWLEYGGERVPVDPAVPEATVVVILDAFEIAVVQGRYFFGVHEATQLDFGLALAGRLLQAIEGASDAQH